jgi:hypothetical protein
LDERVRISIVEAVDLDFLPRKPALKIPVAMKKGCCGDEDKERSN